MSTNSPAYSDDTTVLAQYKLRADYKPLHGDYIVWSGWITTWHGFVSAYDAKTDELLVIFAGVPYLLLTMDLTAQDRETRRLKLSEIKDAVNGKFAIQQFDPRQNTIIWYI